MNYPKEQVNFLQAVLEMREAQKRYFKNRNNATLKAAKAREAKVDVALQPYIAAGVIRTQEKKDEPTDLLF